MYLHFPPSQSKHQDLYRLCCRGDKYVVDTNVLISTDPKDPIAIERLNLMNMAKLSIKGLIESALNLGRTLDSDYAPLQQFFVVMEHCLKHGLKSMWSNFLSL